MKKLITLLLLGPATLFAQKINIGAYGNYGIRNNPYKNTYPTSWATYQDYFGGGVKGNISFKYWQAGIGVDYNGYQASGKVIKDNHTYPFPLNPHDFVGSHLYSRGRYISPYLFINGKKSFLHDRLTVYAGLQGGRAYLNKKKSFTYFEYTNEYYANLAGGNVLIMCEIKAPGMMYGGQLGVQSHLTKRLSVDVSATIRRISINSTTLYNSDLGNGGYTHVYQGMSLKYNFWYYPVTVGLQYTL